MRWTTTAPPCQLEEEPTPNAGRGWSIVVLDSSGTYRLTLDEGTEVLVGRSHDAQIRVQDKVVSRRHALISCIGVPSVLDLGSKTGTVVDGRTLVPEERAQLQDQSRVEVGSAVLLIHEEYTVRRAGGRPLPEITAADQTDSLVASDPRTRELLEYVTRAARTELSILLLGATGVGKELIAEAVHTHSLRAERPFVRVNCSALSATLIEAELFGYEKGAFTGADHAKAGLIEAADGGTLMLDEIGDLPMEAQPKLLRVLEAGEYIRVGSTKTCRANVRFIAATHKNLQRLVATGAFRADLYHRLNGLTVEVPPLRERPGDIPPLVLYFAQRIARRTRIPAPAFDPEALELLKSFPWPGNVRQLRRFIERWLLLSQLTRVHGEHVANWLDKELSDEPVVASPDEDTTRRAVPSSMWEETVVSAEEVPLFPSMAPGDLAGERDRIMSVLTANGGNQGRTAKALGISRRTLINRLEHLGIPRPRKGLRFGA